MIAIIASVSKRNCGPASCCRCGRLQRNHHDGRRGATRFDLQHLLPRSVVIIIS